MWNYSVVSKNSGRLNEHDAVTEVCNFTLEMARKKGLLSASTSAWPVLSSGGRASRKSMRRKALSDKE